MELCCCTRMELRLVQRCRPWFVVVGLYPTPGDRIEGLRDHKRFRTRKAAIEAAAAWQATTAVLRITEEVGSRELQWVVVGTVFEGQFRRVR